MKLADWLAELFSTGHKQAAKAFGQGDAGIIARRYYQCFDFFDCVQFPMMWGTNVGEPDTVDIIRICPEDAPSLVPDVEERRTKLRGLAVAHFGAFLDREWRVGDLLWGRLDGAERIITALLPLHESEKLRNELIDKAHAAILEEFRTELGKMAIDPSRYEGSRQRPSEDALYRAINVIALPAAALNRNIQEDFMSLWCMMTPAEPNRVLLMRTLARGTTTVGRMLDGIAGGSQLSVAAKWITSIGRALWGLVEISVSRRLPGLFWRYWSSLLLLISIILIAAGLVTARPAISGFGWALLAFTM